MQPHDQRVGEVVRVTGGGSSIDVLVVSIEGPKSDRRATLRITAPNGDGHTRSLSRADGCVSVGAGLRVEISPYKAKAGRVGIVYLLPNPEYAIQYV